MSIVVAIAFWSKLGIIYCGYQLVVVIPTKLTAEAPVLTAACSLVATSAVFGCWRCRLETPSLLQLHPRHHHTPPHPDQNYFCQVSISPESANEIPRYADYSSCKHSHSCFSELKIL